MFEDWKIKIIFRNLARKFFKKWIKIYYSQISVDEYEIVASKSKIIDYVKDKIIFDLARKLFEDGMIDFEEETDIRTNRRIIKAKIRII